MPANVETVETVEISDPKAVKALTNPIRYQALSELYDSQIPMTASELARQVGVLPGSMTYHLEKLAGFGLVRRVDDGDATNRRERPWRACGRNFAVMVPEASAGGESSVMLEQVLRPEVERMHELLRAGRPARHAELGYIALSAGRIILDDAERRAMHDEILAVIAKYSQLADHRDPAGDYRGTRVLYSILPDDVKRLE